MSRRRKKQPVYPRCSCCGEPKHRTEMRTVVSVMERLEKAQYPKAYKEFGFDSYDSFLDSDFEWACDSCLHTGKAVLANPNIQRYCWNPYFAYFDTDFICTSCQKEFTFGKEEKRFWFEELKFWTASSPINCVACRKEIRLLKRQNQILTVLLKKDEHSLERSEIEQIAAVYEDWDKIERKKYYEALLRKSSGKTQK